MNFKKDDLNSDLSYFSKYGFLVLNGLKSREFVKMCNSCTGNYEWLRDKNTGQDFYYQISTKSYLRMDKEFVKFMSKDCQEKFEIEENKKIKNV